MKFIASLFTVLFASAVQAKDLSLYCLSIYKDNNRYLHTLYQYKYVDGWFSDNVKERNETASWIFRPKGNTEMQGVVFSLRTEWKDFCPKKRGKLEIFKTDNQASVTCTEKGGWTSNIMFTKARARFWAAYNGKTSGEGQECNFDRRKLLRNNRLYECEPLDDCYN